MTKTPDGIDPDGVTAWLRERVDVDPPLHFHLIEGGRSNLTYRVADAAHRQWVLRRPPLHGVLPSAHDMEREHRIISALQHSNVPVPSTVGHEPDDAVTGAQFYVMDFVEGRVVRSVEDAQQLDPAERRSAGESLVDVLVDLHAVDPDEVGLGGLAKKQDYIARQLRRWHGQLQRGQEQGGRRQPLLDDLHARLESAIPEQEGVSIVHGDYRLDNVIIGADGQVAAVLDWELCTLGDPLADVGMLAVYWPDPSDQVVPLLSAPTTVDGFLRRAEAIARYGECSGRDLSQLDYYVAFAYWKVAVVLEGVYTRFTGGAYGSDVDDSWKAFGDIVIQLGERGMDSFASGSAS